MSPRRARKFLDERSYHITHRCHAREFLLGRAMDRRQYRQRLWEMTQAYAVDVLDYMVTSNHVHLLLSAARPVEISEGLRFLQGSAGQDYNRRKGRSGSFWSGRYRATLIQDGRHLARCLFYIDLNMVRAGAVDHPQEWPCCGYHEIIGRRQRYRIVNRSLLLKKLAAGDEAMFLAWYEATLREKIAAGKLAREAFWSDALAVGDRAWVESIAGRIPAGRRKLALADAGDDPRVAEEQASYYIAAGRRATASMSRRI